MVFLSFFVIRKFRDTYSSVDIAEGVQWSEKGWEPLF